MSPWFDHQTSIADSSLSSVFGPVACPGASAVASGWAAKDSDVGREIPRLTPVSENSVREKKPVWKFF